MTTINPQYVTYFTAQTAAKSLHGQYLSSDNLKTAKGLLSMTTINPQYTEYRIFIVYELTYKFAFRALHCTDRSPNCTANIYRRGECLKSLSLCWADVVSRPDGRQRGLQSEPPPIQMSAVRGLYSAPPWALDMEPGLLGAN